MKILYLGEIGPGQTSLMRMRALERLGHSVRGVHTIGAVEAGVVDQAAGAAADSSRIHRGGNQFHSSVRGASNSGRLWCGRRSRSSCASKRSRNCASLAQDRFTSRRIRISRSTGSARGSWMKPCEQFDALVYCKSYEREQYEALGKPLVYMPLGYCDEVHRPLPQTTLGGACAVGFLGGWEPRRERLLHAVAAAGVDLKIWGGYWDFLRDGKWTLRRHIILRQLAGERQFQLPSR